MFVGSPSKQTHPVSLATSAKCWATSSKHGRLSAKAAAVLTRSWVLAWLHQSWAGFDQAWGKFGENWTASSKCGPVTNTFGLLRPNSDEGADHIWELRAVSTWSVPETPSRRSIHAPSSITSAQYVVFRLGGNLKKSAYGVGRELPHVQSGNSPFCPELRRTRLGVGQAPEYPKYAKLVMPT